MQACTLLTSNNVPIIFVEVFAKFYCLKLFFCHILSLCNILLAVFMTIWQFLLSNLIFYSCFYSFFKCIKLLL